MTCLLHSKSPPPPSTTASLFHYHYFHLPHTHMLTTMSSNLLHCTHEPLTTTTPLHPYQLPSFCTTCKHTSYYHHHHTCSPLHKVLQQFWAARDERRPLPLMDSPHDAHSQPQILKGNAPCHHLPQYDAPAVHITLLCVELPCGGIRVWEEGVCEVGRVC